MSAVIKNLLENAYKYGREDGHILLSLSSADGRAVLRVKDDGPGIAEDKLPLVFNRFWQEDPSRSDNGSSGLGLAIVKEAAVLHHGSVRAESRPGEGTEFIFTL